ncbi:hypothetical protein [Streptomyces sp. NPDC056165]|uniref:hypothetical protein n=1 Tax=Streptomyces sp. NPDC056165 TaxID=3345733 RepID=UPI0035E0A300
MTFVDSSSAAATSTTARPGTATRLAGGRRLNRGGNRQANSALYTVVLARLRWDSRTRGYIDRRIAEGKTRREALRCLKRYVARGIHRLIASSNTGSETHSLAA